MIPLAKAHFSAAPSTVTHWTFSSTEITNNRQRSAAFRRIGWHRFARSAIATLLAVAPQSPEYQSIIHFCFSKFSSRGIAQHG
jgi:hypothetical protein